MDLTRFDFHVVRFMSSETVKRMTAEEVGQYLLLLCDAWLLGKEASLPDDPAYLARTARCQKVSPLVLSKFPVVQMECGKRRQNKALLAEWAAASERYQSARQRGSLGGKAKWANARSNSTALDTSKTEQYPIPIIPHQAYQTKPDQPVPKEEIARQFAIDDEKTKRENEEFLAAKKKQDDFNEANRGLI